MVSSVSRKMLRKRTIAKTAIMPNAVMRLLESTFMTMATSVGIMTSALTNEREYESPECVSMYTHAMMCPMANASNKPSASAGKFVGAIP